MSRTTPEDATIGRRIRDLRTRQGLTQQALATQIGVTFQQVQKYERGVNRVSASTLIGVARALDVPTSALLGQDPRDDDPVAALRDHPSGLALARAWVALTPELQRAVLQLATAAAPPVIVGGGDPLRINFGRARSRHDRALSV